MPESEGWPAIFRQANKNGAKIMDGFFPPVTEQEDPNLEEEEQEQGTLLMNMGLLCGGVGILYVMMGGETEPFGAIVFYVLYLCAFFTVAAGVGLLRKYDVRGFGQTAPLLRKKYLLDPQERAEIEDYSSTRTLPSHQRFLRRSSRPKEEKDEIYKALQKDFTSEGFFPRFDEYDDYLSLVSGNSLYTGLFFLMSVVFIIPYLFADSGLFRLEETWLVVLVMVALEESLKGVGFFVVTTKEVRLTLFSYKIPEPATKGLVVGTGYAFIETYMWLVDGRHPLLNFLMRLPALGIHMLCSAVFFMGLAALVTLEGKKHVLRPLKGTLTLRGGWLPRPSVNGALLKKGLKDPDVTALLHGITLVVSAVLLHFFLNQLLGWLL